jgi:hypothetical protein
MITEQIINQNHKTKILQKKKQMVNEISKNSRNLINLKSSKKDTS